MNRGLGLSLRILSDGCGTELLIVLVRHHAQRFDCVNSFEITCSAALTDPHGRVSQHHEACLNALTCFMPYVCVFIGLNPVCYKTDQNFGDKKYDVLLNYVQHRWAIVCKLYCV